ncbi:hypothetical protein ACIBJE_02400 [Micromonospora sp. NPDC050187]|uniref:hypothetical protein n=1 Tax=Micromonospora sp. NPDC050187 TaxID=3364277 RepID=UPI00378E96B5
MQTNREARSPVLFGFMRRYVVPRLGDTLLHRNVAISLFLAGSLTFATFRLRWFPAFEQAEVKDFVAGSLAFSALGFGAATAATVLALSMPRSRLYLTMIMNGKDAPRVRVISRDGRERVAATNGAPLNGGQYGPAFRSYYGDLIFIFLWTMAAQLFMGIASLIYFAIAGDLNMADSESCRRASAGLFIVSAAISYAVMQLGSLIKALADYASRQEQYDRIRLIGPEDASKDVTP